MWRDFVMLAQDSTRPHSACFDPANVGKASVVIDYSTAEGVTQLKRLLRDCDVLITNVRLASLRRAGLHYDQLHAEFPHLIYASLTAWGSHGPDCELPGYDLGAFYVATGLAGMSQVNPEYVNYSTFLTGFGDMTTAAALATGIGAAMAHRQRCGKGQLVSTSLLKMGYWTMSTELVDELNRRGDGKKATSSGTYGKAPDYTKIAVAPPLQDAYKTKDGVTVQLAGQAWPDGSLNQQSKREDVAKKIAQLNKDEIPVPHVEIPTIARLHGSDLPHEGFRHANVFQKTPPGNRAAPIMHRMPVDLSCSSEHGSHRPAPLLGQHSKSILRDGWSPRDEPKAWGREEGVKSFTGMRVWEWADTVNLVAQVAGTQMMHFGATVWQTEKGTPDLLQLRRDKNTLKETITMQSDFSQCDVLITNLPEVDVEELHRRFPHLVIAECTPFGRGGATEPRCSLGPFTSASGACHFHGAGGDGKGGVAERLPPFPRNMGDFICGQHMAMGLSFALYHKLLSGKGQIVSVNLLRSGMAGFTGVSTPLNLTTNVYMKLAPVQVLQEVMMVPTANTFQMKDGWRITLLGADFLRHLGRTIKALGFGKAYYLKVAATVAKTLLHTREKKEVMLAAMRQLNNDFKEAFAQKTWEEWRPIFAEHDIWYAPVNMLPEALSYYQAHEIGIFKNKGEIAFPITMYGYGEEQIQ